jgi:hypothetical protein
MLTKIIIHTTLVNEYILKQIKMNEKRNINISTILYGVHKLEFSFHLYPRLGSFGFGAQDSTHLRATATEAPSA